MLRVLTIFGTRPEAIKLASIVHKFGQERGVAHYTCVTGQHRQMLDPILNAFAIVPDFDLEIMRPGQDLSYVTSSVLTEVLSVIDEVKPHWVIVQGDTTSAFAAALAAFYRKVKVAHVEAGLRTGNTYSPWPEEMNRKLISQLANRHFAPTTGAASNLAREGVSTADIVVTGNTVIDALLWVVQRLDNDHLFAKNADDQLPNLDEKRKLILVTGHRRDNLDGGIASVCTALKELAKREDVEIVYPVHLNPRVQEPVQAILRDVPFVHLLGPLDYVPFVSLMRRCHFIITDSGGIQEEAPALGKPVLVTRESTERPEVLAAGNAKIIGTDAKAVLAAANSLLDDGSAYNRMAKARNPFGDGAAADKIVENLLGIQLSPNIS